MNDSFSFRNFRSLRLSGKTFPEKVLRAFAQKQSERAPAETWEKHFYRFIKEWLNENDFVETKTSGTTGVPKIIRLEKNKMLASAFLTLRYLQINENNNALLALSCEHIAGKMMVVRAFAGKLNLFTVSPTANPLLHFPENRQIDFAALVPLQVKDILSNSATVHRFEKIRKVIIGGAPVSAELVTILKKKRNDVFETFGMTETISHIALKKISGNDDNNEDSQNPDFETLEGVFVETDKRGCLVIHAPFLSEKPIVTNDLVELQDENHFRWLGRLDNAVNSGGVKLIPELLEEKVRRLISQRFFFAGLPDEKLGEKLILVIESNQYPEEQLALLQNKLSDVLGKYELPKSVFFIPVFSETSSGKINRKKTLAAFSENQI